MTTERMTLATFETPNFTFQALGVSKSHSLNLLIRAWKRHCDTSGAELSYILDFEDDIQFLSIRTGSAWKDNEIVVDV